MRRIQLDFLAFWIDEELYNGNRVKASILYKIFCKYAKIRYPKITESELKHYSSRIWD